MGNRILVFYGSYRSDRMGIRLAQFVIERLRHRGDDAELIDAKAVNLPILDRMYKEYPKGEAPEVLEQLARKIREADGFVFVTGEYNWGIQAGLKTSRIISLRSGSGVLLLSSAIRPDDLPACVRRAPGTASSRKWGWWWPPARSPLAPLDRLCRPKPSPWARAARRLNRRSRALPMTSRGG